MTDKNTCDPSGNLHSKIIGESSAQRRFSLLFVDDEISVLSALKRAFIKENYDIFLASSGREALSILQHNHIDLVISDYRMPEMDGVEFLVKARSLQPEMIRIILTGFTDIRMMMSAINEGSIYKFITKPWDDDDLMSTGT